MPYAVSDDVILRAGRFGPAFSVEGKRPNLADVDALLGDVAAELDTAIRAHGFDPAALSATIKAALKDLNAYGVLYRLLPARSDPEMDALISKAERIWLDGLAAIVKGTFPPIAELLAGEGGQGSSFWHEQPSYPTATDVQLAHDHRSLAPSFFKGQPL